MKPWADWLYDHRRAMGLTILLVTAFFAWQARHLMVATRINDLYPKNHPHTELHRKFPAFGSPLTISLVIETTNNSIYQPRTLAKIQQATRLLDLVPGVDHDQLLSIASPKVRNVSATAAGVHADRLLVGAIPDTAKGLDELRERVRSTAGVIGILVSADERAALIQASFIEEPLDYELVFTAVNAIIAKLKDHDHEIYAAGQPLLTGWVYYYRQETALIFAATLAGMVLLLTLHMRNFAGTVTPLIASFATALWGLGIAALFGINMDPLIWVLPVLLIARSMSHAIQACERYFEIYYESGNQRQACVGSLVSLFPPGLLGIVTDAVGLFCIAIAPLPVLEKTAIATGFWALSLIPANLLLTPILLSFLPPPRNAAAVVGHELALKSAPDGALTRAIALFHRGVDRMLRSAAVLSRGNAAWVTSIGLIVITIWASLTASRVVIGDAQPGTSILWPGSAYNTAIAKINQRFAGFDVLQVVVEAQNSNVTVHSPAALDLMQRFQRHMEQDPQVIATFSFADLVVATNRLLHGDVPKWGIIPASENDAAMLSQLAVTGASLGDLDRYFARDRSAANINIWYKDHRGETIDRAIKRAHAFADAEFNETSAGFKLSLASGTLGLLAAVNETVVRSQWRIFLAAMALIFMLCALLYRSLLIAAILLVPVNFANLLANALMVHLGIGLDVNTLPVIAVGTGVGIDYAIYLMSRIREERHNQSDFDGAVRLALATTGRAIFFTATTLCLGLAPWYFFSSLRFQAHMGLLIGALMLINLLAALVLVPLLVLILRPLFPLGPAANVKCNGVQGASVNWRKHHG